MNQNNIKIFLFKDFWDKQIPVLENFKEKKKLFILGINLKTNLKRLISGIVL